MGTPRQKQTLWLVAIACLVAACVAQDKPPTIKFCRNDEPTPVDQLCAATGLSGENPGACEALSFLAGFTNQTQPPMCKADPDVAGGIELPPSVDEHDTVLPQDLPDIRSYHQGLVHDLDQKAFMKAEGATYFWYFRNLLSFTNWAPCTLPPSTPKKAPAVKAPNAAKKAPDAKAPDAAKGPDASKQAPKAVKAPNATKKAPAVKAPGASKQAPKAVKAPDAAKKAPDATKKAPDAKGPVAKAQYEDTFIGDELMYEWSKNATKNQTHHAYSEPDSPYGSGYDGYGDDEERYEEEEEQYEGYGDDNHKETFIGDELMYEWSKNANKNQTHHAYRQPDSSYGPGYDGYDEGYRSHLVGLPVPEGWQVESLLNIPKPMNGVPESNEQMPFAVVLKPDPSSYGKRRDSCRRWYGYAAKALAQGKMEGAAKRAAMAAMAASRVEIASAGGPGMRVNEAGPVPGAPLTPALRLKQQQQLKRDQEEQQKRELEAKQRKEAEEKRKQEELQKAMELEQQQKEQEQKQQALEEQRRKNETAAANKPRTVPKAPLPLPNRRRGPEPPIKVDDKDSKEEAAEEAPASSGDEADFDGEAYERYYQERRRHQAAQEDEQEQYPYRQYYPGGSHEEDEREREHEEEEHHAPHYYQHDDSEHEPSDHYYQRRHQQQEEQPYHPAAEEGHQEERQHPYHPAAEEGHHHDEKRQQQPYHPAAEEGHHHEEHEHPKEHEHVEEEPKYYGHHEHEANQHPHEEPEHPAVREPHHHEEPEHHHEEPEHSYHHHEQQQHVPEHPSEHADAADPVRQHEREYKEYKQAEHDYKPEPEHKQPEYKKPEREYKQPEYKPDYSAHELPKDAAEFYNPHEGDKHTSYEEEKDLHLWEADEHYDWERDRYGDDYSCGSDDYEAKTAPELVVLLRGSSALWEYGLGQMYNTVPDVTTDFGPGHIHAGFLYAAQALWHGGLKELVEKEVEAGCRSVTLAGYSMGGAVAQLLAVRIEALIAAKESSTNYEHHYDGSKPSPVTAVTFGSPAVGDATWATNFNKKLNARNILFAGDATARFPCEPSTIDCGDATGVIFPYQRTGANIIFNGASMPCNDKYEASQSWTGLETITGSQFCNEQGAYFPNAIAAHMCSYLCMTSQFVDHVTNNLCWLDGNNEPPAHASMCNFNGGSPVLLPAVTARQSKPVSA